MERSSASISGLATSMPERAFAAGLTRTGIGLHGRKGKGYVEYGTAIWIVFCPESAAVDFDNGTRYGQADPHPVFLRGHKRVEDSLRIVDSRSFVDHLDEHLVLICGGRPNHNAWSGLAGFRGHHRRQHL